jgi:hypothetical protein
MVHDIFLSKNSGQNNNRAHRMEQKGYKQNKKAYKLTITDSSMLHDIYLSKNSGHNDNRAHRMYTCDEKHRKVFHCGGNSAHSKT